MSYEQEGDPRHCLEGAPSDRNYAYKMLIQDIAERLGPEDINSITFQESLPDSAKGFSSLSLLRQLEREGLFSPSNIQPLADLLRRIHRHDLVNNYVEVYLGGGRHYSMPTQKSPRTNTKSRSLSEPQKCITSQPPFQRDPNSHATPGSSPNWTELQTPQEAPQTGLKHEPFSFPQMSTHQQSPFGPHDEGRPTHARHMSEQLHSHTGYFPKTSTPTIRDHQQTPFVHVQPTSLHSAQHSRQHSSGGVSLVSASSSMHEYMLGADLSSSRPSSYSELSGIASEASSPHHSPYHSGHQSPKQRKGNSLNSSFRSVSMADVNQQISQQMSHGIHLQVPRSSFPSSCEQLAQARCDVLNRVADQILLKSMTPPAMGTKRRVGNSPSGSQPASSVNHSASEHSLSHGHAASDSGLEMLPHVLSQYSTSSIGDSIQPWMSVSNEHLRMQPRSSTATIAVQTEHESDDTPTPRASLYSKDPEDEEIADQMQETSRKQKPSSLLKKFKLPLPKSSRSSSQELKWTLKRNDLNEPIYKHKKKKCFTSSDKLELDVGCGKANPKLVFKLYPYGLEQDRGKNTTLEVEIEVPKKSTRLPDSATLKLAVTALDCKEARVLKTYKVEKSMHLRTFLVQDFVSHDDLKKSHSDLIEIQASAEVTGVPTTPSEDS